MRYLTIILLFISSLAMAQRPYLFPTIADAASNTYIGIGAYVQTQGYSASGDGGGALYRMTAIGSAPMAADSGYVYPVTASKVLVQVLEDEYLRTATYGVVCGSSAEATNNYNRLQRFFTAINTLDKQAFVNGCNDTIYVNFTSALTTTLTSHDKFVMRGEGADVTRIKATAGSIDFGFSDAAKVNLFDLYLHGYDATAFGGIGGADQSLTYVNDTLTISGGNFVVITGGGGGGTDDQTISIDSNAFKYTLSIESGNSVTFAKVTDTDTDDQTLSFSSPNLSISEGNTVDLSALQDGTGTDDQTLTLDSVSGTYNLTIESGNTVKIKRDTDTDDQTLSLVTNTLSISEGNSVDLAAYLDNTDDQVISIDSNATTYTLTLESGGSIKILKSVNTDAQTLSFSNPNLSISGGNSVDISGIDTDTDDQTLSIDSNATTYTLTIVDGNNVKFAKGGGGGGGSPGGNNNDIQFNRSSSFTGTDSLEWVGASGELKVLGRINTIFNTSSIAIGSTALLSDDGNNFNIGIGEGALADVTSGTANIAIGYFAGENMTTQTNCVAIGQFALRNNTGSSNFGIGPSSLLSSTGSENTAIGHSALQNNTSGARCTSIGTSALLSNTTGSDNTAVGQEALRNNTTTSFNTAVGRRALRASTGSSNTSFGWYGLNEITSGSQNVALGAQAGRYYGASTTILTTANDVVLLGYDSRPSANSASNEIVIGSQSRGNGNNTATYGNTSITDHYFNGTVRSSGAYIGRVTTFNSTPSQTTFGAYICHVDYTTTGAFSLVIDTDNLVAGYTLIVKDVDGNAGANNITISTEGAETIDGASTYVISTNYGSVQLYSDGVNWYTY